MQGKVQNAVGQLPIHIYYENIFNTSIEMQKSKQAKILITF